MGNYWVWRSK